MRSYKTPVFLTAVLAAGLVSAPSLGSEAYCGTFELIGDVKTVTLIDVPPEGDSIGDIRTGIMDFIDPRTDDVIKLHYRNKIIEVGDDDVHKFVGDHVWEFPDGDLLFTRNLYYRTNDTRPRGMASKATNGIVGGTGAFARVRGEITGPPGDAPVRRFDLDCG